MYWHAICEIGSHSHPFALDSHFYFGFNFSIYAYLMKLVKKILSKDDAPVIDLFKFRIIQSYIAGLRLLRLNVVKYVNEDWS